MFSIMYTNEVLLSGRDLSNLIQLTISELYMYKKKQ